MARRGRKRSNLPRYRGGQVKPVGRGERKIPPTPERIARRVEATGRSDLHETWPLDVLKGREAISHEQAFAGYRFALQYWRCYGSPPSVSGHWRRIALGFSAFYKDCELDEPGRRHAYLAADAALTQAGSDARAAVLKTAVYLEPPSSIEDLVTGLSELERHFRTPRNARPGAGRRPVGADAPEG